MTDESKKELKKTIRNEVSPLLIGLRNDIKDLSEIISKGTALPELVFSEKEKSDILAFKLSITPQKGVDYFDGYTPVLGEDYFTTEEIFSFKDSIAAMRCLF